MALTGKIMDFFADKAMTTPAFPRTKVKAVSDDNNVGLNVLLDEKQKKHTPISVTLSASGWTNLTQTVSVPGVTSSNTVIVTPAPSSHAVYGEAGVYCSGQSSESLTFTYTSVPTAALTVNVIILD